MALLGLLELLKASALDGKTEQLRQYGALFRRRLAQRYQRRARLLQDGGRPLELVIGRTRSASRIRRRRSRLSSRKQAGEEDRDPLPRPARHPPTAAGRHGAHQADPDQPYRKRRKVHGNRRGGSSRSRPPVKTHGDTAAAPLRGERYGYRHFSGGAGEDFRFLLAGRFIDHPASSEERALG